LVLREVPAPVSQFEVVLPSGKRARLDLAWPDALVAVEYDGPEHRTITGQNRDAFRDEGLDALGWEVVHVTSAMVLDPRAADRLAARIARKLRGRLR
jgi:very-short-patch-repair endonuclease